MVCLIFKRILLFTFYDIFFSV